MGIHTRSPRSLAPAAAIGTWLLVAQSSAAQVLVAADEYMVIPEPTLVDKLYLAFRNNPPGWFFVHHPFLSLIVTVAVVAWALNRERESREDSTFDPAAQNVTVGWAPQAMATADRPAWLDGTTDIDVAPRQAPAAPLDTDPASKPAWMS